MPVACTRSTHDENCVRLPQHVQHWREMFRKWAYAAVSTPALRSIWTPLANASAVGKSGAQSGSGGDTPSTGTIARIGMRAAACATRTQSVVVFAL